MACAPDDPEIDPQSGACAQMAEAFEDAQGVSTTNGGFGGVFDMVDVQNNPAYTVATLVDTVGQESVQTCLCSFVDGDPMGLFENRARMERNDASTKRSWSPAGSRAPEVSAGANGC